MRGARIASIEWGTLMGRRPRLAGYNARKKEDHGWDAPVPLARITTADGAAGFGVSTLTRRRAELFLGSPLNDLITAENGVGPKAFAIESPLWDLLGQRAGRPVYQILADRAGKKAAEPLRVPCYDTTLLIDDLHLATDEEGAALIASEARFGYENGHRAFKIKVGRGARHMPLEEGNCRDIAVVRAVRAAVGPDAAILIDANNGYTLNIAKQILRETADCNIFWLEEAFHEDDELYEDLHAWIAREGLSVLIADGEGSASPHLLDYARRGIVDVVQYDIFSYGMTKWLQTAPKLDAWNVRSAPHHYGRHLGNFVSGHLAPAVENFAFVEWDELTTPGLDTSAYAVNDGYVSLPQAPGFGLNLDESLFQQAVKENGFVAKSS
ncbi:MAG: mandelate racemase [Caldilineaceae bacterium SB0661_bin_32]|uniref:Mandelate racemase n=1 Tax=Caldilineaceae bacterium SB0661_bin_32 TaxID=2605255 RepID=A0A6B1D1X3_9CHLR|nr:mandelate racemase [Caldilineaceae bacterium SB0661_bin_32]